MSSGGSRFESARRSPGSRRRFAAPSGVPGPVIAVGPRRLPRHDRRMDEHGGVIYQHPLAYLLGLEGIALLHAFGGEYDVTFTVERIEECRALLAKADLLGPGHVASPMSTPDGYRDWAPVYDSPGNQLIDIEQPVVWEILDGLPVGVALDAACGTGRHTARLKELGHTVVGLDSSSEMLAVARATSLTSTSGSASWTRYLSPTRAWARSSAHSP